MLLDRVVGGSDDEDLEEHERTATLHFCRHCGAAHPESRRAAACTAALRERRSSLYAVRQKKDNPGVLTSCLSCGANGRRIGSNYREPARPVRATNVADVHVLAQDMVHHSERPRLLVFCDNRQDAAFQAGWMKDHARRFRLRALMAEGMKSGAVSVGDLALHLDDVLEKDEALSRALVPEVWQVVRKEGGGGRHEQERRKFLRIQVLREVTLSSRQSIGLEPWGRMKVEYEGLDRGAALDPGARARAWHACRGSARRRREPARLPAAQAGAARSRARDLHQVLDGRRSRGAAGLPAAGRESRRAPSFAVGPMRRPSSSRSG